MSMHAMKGWVRWEFFGASRLDVCVEYKYKYKYK